MAKATHAHITPVPETHSPNMPINLARRLLLAGLPAAVAIAAVPAIAPQPDAELISLCEELQRLHDARLAGFANDIEPLQYEEPAAWKAWDERGSHEPEFITMRSTTSYTFSPPRRRGLLQRHGRHV